MVVVESGRTSLFTRQLSDGPSRMRVCLPVEKAKAVLSPFLQPLKYSVLSHPVGGGGGVVRYLAFIGPDCRLQLGWGEVGGMSRPSNEIVETSETRVGMWETACLKQERKWLIFTKKCTVLLLHRMENWQEHVTQLSSNCQVSAVWPWRLRLWKAVSCDPAPHSCLDSFQSKGSVFTSTAALT